MRTPPASIRSRPPLLRIRVLAANLDTDDALALLHETAATDPGTRMLLAAVSLENARWLLKHLHREDLARRWLAEARARIDPAATAAMRCEPIVTNPLRQVVMC